MYYNTHKKLDSSQAPRWQLTNFIANVMTSNVGNIATPMSGSHTYSSSFYVQHHGLPRIIESNCIHHHRSKSQRPQSEPFYRNTDS